MARVRAPPVRVQRPLERHPFDGIQRGTAADLLIARGIGMPRSNRRGAMAPECSFVLCSPSRGACFPPEIQQIVDRALERNPRLPAGRILQAAGVSNQNRDVVWTEP